MIPQTCMHIHTHTLQQTPLLFFINSAIFLNEASSLSPCIHKHSKYHSNTPKFLLLLAIVTCYEDFGEREREHGEEREKRRERERECVCVCEGGGRDRRKKDFHLLTFNLSLGYFKSRIPALLHEQLSNEQDLIKLQNWLLNIIMQKKSGSDTADMHAHTCTHTHTLQHTPLLFFINSAIFLNDAS